MQYKDKSTPSNLQVVANKRNSINYNINGISKSNVGRFKKHKLPLPIAVLYSLNIHQGRINRAGYWIISCPFHKNGNEKHPSLNLHQICGNFICHACGAKGGDILSFFMQYTGNNFIDSAKLLGAWEYDE